jgi:hypothetical protein
MRHDRQKTGTAMDEGLRASDADRDRAAAQLQVHFAAGRLTPGELDDRLAVALRAATFGDLRRALAGLPGPAPAPQRDGSLERGYRRLLAFYPAAHRRVHAEEMLAVLMTAAPEGKRRPGLAEAADLIAGALRVWCQPSRGGVAGWRGVLALASAGAVLGLLAGLVFAGVYRPPATSEATVWTQFAYPRGDPAGGRWWYRINLPALSLPAAERKKLIEQRYNEAERNEWRTEAALAASPRVMTAAARAVRPVMSVQELRSQVRISRVNYRLWFSAQGATAAQARHAVGAVAHSYIAYVKGKNARGGRILLRVLACQPGPCQVRPRESGPFLVPGPSPLAVVLDNGGLGALCGALIAAAGAVALGRPSRRFRMT